MNCPSGEFHLVACYVVVPDVGPTHNQYECVDCGRTWTQVPRDREKQPEQSDLIAKLLKEAATEQAAPNPGRVAVLPYVHAAIDARAKMGEQRYGTLLKTGNGRDALMDALQESLDAPFYIMQALLEREGL